MQTKTQAQAPPAPLLTPTELRQHFAVSRWTVDQWIKDGCPVRRLPSGHKRYDLAAVNEWLDKQQAANAA